jgi:uncharacterized coiled-coil protein SlyX
MASQRIEDLEVKVAFQEHTIAQLDEELRKTIDRLEKLERRVEELVAEHASSVDGPIDEKPPHY